MTLSTRAIAVQGFGFGRLHIGVQGFSPLLLVPVAVGVGGLAFEHAAVRKATVWDDLPLIQRNRHHRMLLDEDRFASDFILSIVTTGFLNA